MADSVIAFDAESVEAMLILPKAWLALFQIRFSTGHEFGLKAI